MNWEKKKSWSLLSSTASKFVSVGCSLSVTLPPKLDLNKDGEHPVEQTQANTLQDICMYSSKPCYVKVQHSQSR